MIDRNSVSKIENINKLELDGSDDENWIRETTSSMGFRYYLKLDATANKAISDNTNINVLCNKLTSATATATWCGEEGISASTNLQIYLKEYSVNKTVADFKVFLSENPITAYYVLAVSKEIPITNESFISQLEELINIEAYETTNITVTSKEDDACLPLLEFLYNYVTASPTTERQSSLKIVEGNYEIINQNKNLTKIELENCFRNYQDGNVVKKDSYNSYITKVEPNNNYTLSYNEFNEYPDYVSNLCYFDKNMNYLGGVPFSSSNKKITIIDNCYYITTAVNKLATDFQIERENQATEYVEHKEEKYQLNIPENIKLYSNNDGFVYLTQEQAEEKALEGEGWYAINYLNEFVVDGENYKATTCDRNKNGSTYINIPLTANLKRPDDYWSSQPLAYCNYLKNSICNLAEIDTFAIWDSVYNNTNDVYVRLRTLLELNTYDEVNEYFKSLYDEGNPLKFVLELETPTYKKITDENFISQLEALQKAFSYYQVTNITANSTDDLDKAPLYLSVEYLKSQKLINENLRNEIDNLKALILEQEG